MVFFKDYTCLSSQLKYLIVGTEGSTVETKFLVQDSFVGRYVDPWPQLRNMLHMRSWTSEYDHKSNKASKVWYLEKPNPQRTNIANTISNLGRRMILKELRWGDNIVLEGEYHCIPGYWEWTEDVLCKNGQSLNNACISDAVFASLFTYDRNSNIVQAFCEAWCPQTNTLLTSIGETSISLWDLHILGEIPTEINTWSSTQEMVFSKLGAKHQKYETYLTAFLSCWLCAFVFPSEEGNFIWPETFKIASLMASSKRLAYYLKTHYPLTSGPSLPRMVVYSGKGVAKYFDKDEAKKCVHRGENIVWNATMLSKPHPTYYIDNGKAPELELAYFMSLRFNYLPLKRGGSFVIEPYSPHRFSRQFGFHQDIPGYLENDIRAESLDEGLRYWRICISRATMSKATFPPAVTSAKKLYTTQYSSWWERSYGMVLEDNLDVMVEKVVSEFVTLLEDKSQDIEKTLSKVKTPLAPQHQSKKINSSKVSKKEVVHTSTDKEKCPQFLFSSKRAFQETSKTSKDRCWKRQRVEPSGAEVVDLRVVEVQSVDSPSRSMTIQSDKVNATGHPLGSPHEMPQVSDESTAISRPKAQSISNIEQEQKTSSTSRGQTLKGLTPNSNEFSRVLPKSNGAMSVFEGKGVVFNHKRKYILGLWEEIYGKLSRTSLDNISSYKDDICEIFKEMSEMNLLDISPLKSLVDSLFDHATSYDQEHSNFVDKAHEDKKMELISNAKERLELFKVEEGEKAKHVSFNKKSLKKVKRKLATLQGEREGLEIVLEAAKKKVKEVQAKILATEDEISSYENMSLLTLEDSIRLEQKRECLKASRQDLTNYKLC
ncbi:hypothetical protein KY290_007107 [Solanum tuberosum]|uniref:Aminotransferase-like plant mobile domain-containing protein n=1 Tax=Solanum tuberosum TaxID=4113 RepID=A0ABQ7W5Y9_SOLTU|nr:hypothetical protein KY290_007107 [Solanum tuberosum]